MLRPKREGDWVPITARLDSDASRRLRVAAARRGTTQYNSQNSGQHSKHASKGVACIQCHNTTTLATSHFVGLKTTSMDQAAARLTMGGGTTKVKTYTAPSCTPTTTNGCHSTLKWQ